MSYWAHIKSSCKPNHSKYTIIEKFQFHHFLEVPNCPYRLQNLPKPPLRVSLSETPTKTLTPLSTLHPSVTHNSLLSLHLLAFAIHLFISNQYAQASSTLRLRYPAPRRRTSPDHRGSNLLRFYPLGFGAFSITLGFSFSRYEKMIYIKILNFYVYLCRWEKLMPK